MTIKRLKILYTMMNDVNKMMSIRLLIN